LTRSTEYFGLPTASIEDLYSSVLINKDITTFLHGRDRTETKHILDDVKRSVEDGESLSVKVSFNLNRKKLFVSLRSIIQ
jgi:hypothetical protein